MRIIQMGAFCIILMDPRSGDMMRSIVLVGDRGGETCPATSEQGTRRGFRRRRVEEAGKMHRGLTMLLVAGLTVSPARAGMEEG